MKSKIDSVYIQHDKTKICQGDIFRDYTIPLMAGTNLSIPYMVVLTQECDLDEDFNNHLKNEPEKGDKKQDKYLQSILICPIYIAEQLRNGQHLEGLELKMEKYNSDRWARITSNQNYRYYFLKGNQEYQIPDCVIDFKHYYTIPRDFLYANYKEHYIGTINELFREALSQRFAYYLCRIGLPVFPSKGIECNSE